MIIALEGCDFCGKTTLADYFHHERGWVVLHDPGSTPLTTAMREILLHRRDIPISERQMALLFMGCHSSIMDRADELSAAGANVVLDRTYLSNYAYRMAGGLALAHLRMLVSTFLPNALPPGRIFYLSAPFDVRMQRRRAVAGAGTDRFESQPSEYMQKVEAAYETLATLEYCTRLDGNRPREEVAADILARLDRV